MIPQMLADAAAAPPDTLVSGNWIIAVIGAVSTILGMFWAHQRGKTSQGVILNHPVPELPVRKVYSPPSFSQHMDLVRRIEVVESNVADLRRDQGQQFIRLMEVGEKRKDDILEKFEGVARGFHARVDQFMAEKRKGGA